MSFTCDCELEVAGGEPEDRSAAARIVLAADCVEEGDEALRTVDGAIAARFSCADGLPENELVSVAAQFPGLALTLAYFSRDGEFYGYAQALPGGESAESADFDDRTFESLTSEYSGDGIAFVRASFGLGPLGGSASPHPGDRPRAPRG